MREGEGRTMSMRIDRRGLIDHQRTFDRVTGEVEQGALVWVPQKPRSQFGKSWFQMAQDTLRKINAHRRELGLEGIVVFNALMARLDFENYIQVSQSEIAREVGMKPSNVSRAMRKILDLGFIKQGPKVGRSHTYQLHPDLAWKGKPKAHFKAREAARAAGWQVIEGGTSPDDPEGQMKLDLS